MENWGETKSSGHWCRQAAGAQRKGDMNGQGGWGKRFWPSERPGGEEEACVGEGWRLPARTSPGSPGGLSGVVGLGRTLVLEAPDPGPSSSGETLASGPSPFSIPPVLKSPRHL